MSCSSFWDIIVLSSGDEEQKKSYEQQIALKKSRKEIPGFVKYNNPFMISLWMQVGALPCRYVVTCDPPGAKIGNGGATMHVLEQLQVEISPEQLLQGE